MTAVSTAQFASQSASLITTLKDGTLDDADFTTQWAALLASWGVSNPALAQGVQTLITQTAQYQAQILNWVQGAATGGAANAQGTGTGGPYYPITGVDGTTRWVICPAGVAANATGPSTALSPSAVDSLAAASADSYGNIIATNPAVPVSVDAAAGARQLAKLNFFPSRRTADLQPTQAILGSDVLQMYSAALGAARDVQVSLGVLNLGLTGCINPKLPPYNCKGDVQEVRDAEITNASNVVYSPSGLFTAGDVGKQFGCTVIDGGQPAWGTITAFVDAQHVQVSLTATTTQTGRFLWGTDDTAGMQAALNAIWGAGSYDYGGCLLLPPGGYLCQALTHGPRCSIVGAGGRTSYFVKRPQPRPSSFETDQTVMTQTVYPYSTIDAPQMINHLPMDDFPCFINVGFWGAWYYQRYGTGSSGQYQFADGYVYQSVTGSYTTPQNDPYVWHSGVRVWEAAGNGFSLYNRHSGISQAIEALGCGKIGILFGCYDANVSGLHAESNGYQGVHLMSGGGNNNLMNIKSSFNGEQATTGSRQNAANMTIESTGNNITNVRLQESWGSNLVFLTANWNKIANLACDDTGDMWPAHGIGTFPLLPYRAAIAFLDNQSIGNYILDGTIGAVVESTSYMTHAVFMEGDASQNFGRLFTRPGTTYYDGGPGPNNTTIPAGTGQYAPGPTGTTSSGGFGSSNQFTINGASVP